MIRHRTQPDKSTNQQPIHIWPDLFMPLFLYFPTLTSPQITWTSCFPCLWFLPYTCHNKPRVNQHTQVTRATTKPQLKCKAWISFLTSLTRPGSRDTWTLLGSAHPSGQRSPLPTPVYQRALHTRSSSPCCTLYHLWAFDLSLPAGGSRLSVKMPLKSLITFMLSLQLCQTRQSITSNRHTMWCFPTLKFLAFPAATSLEQNYSPPLPNLPFLTLSSQHAICDHKLLFFCIP